MADVNSQDRDGNTVLMLSVQSGKLQVVDELLKSTSLDLLRLNSKKRNAIFTAILYKRPGLFDKMITSEHVSKLGHFENASGLGEREHLNELGDRLLKAVDVDGYSPLFYATDKSLVAEIKLLRKFGLKLSKHEQKGTYPKWFQACEEGNIKRIRCILLAGFDPAAVDDDGNTGMILAAKAGQEDTFKTLFGECSAESLELNNQDNNGYSALHWAVKSGELRLVQWLANSDCNLSLVAEDSTTPIQIAEMEGYEEIFNYLKDRGALLMSTPQLSLSGDELDDLLCDRCSREIIMCD